MAKNVKRKKESPAEKAVRAKKIVSATLKSYPESKTELTFQSPLELLIATILSAQCTDVRVNIVTKDLFRKYRTVEDYATVRQSVLEADIRSTGFYKNKAKNIIACCKGLIERFDGKVPDRMDDLVTLAGVGRKTANCVLGAAFGIVEGVVVDTHVARLAGRLGFTKENDAVRIERDLMELIPKKHWYTFSNALVLHGRRICKARQPNCPACPLLAYCPSAELYLPRIL
jgi:endonuclease III